MPGYQSEGRHEGPPYWKAIHIEHYIISTMIPLMYVQSKHLCPLPPSHLLIHFLHFMYVQYVVQVHLWIKCFTDSLQQEHDHTSYNFDHAFWKSEDA